MKESVIEKLKILSERHAELSDLLSKPEVTDDMSEFTKLNKEYAELTDVVEKFKEYNQSVDDMKTAEELLSDPDMKEFAQSEFLSAKDRIEQIEAEVQTLLLPKDVNDDKSIYLEIRAGTGGDESALFSGDLFRMYSRYAERMGWSVEVVSSAS
ncbi:MAG: PCRF domain-containing protein [Burkholderiales bacterium]|nr:PCRF domain-containing protein [Burkholderiales bacterium]